MSADFLRSRRALFALAGILALGSGVWGFTVLTKNKKAALPRELSADALKAESDPGKVFEKARQAMDRKDLTEEQRHQIWDNVHDAMEVRMDQRMDEYFAAAPAQRAAIIDRHLDEMQVHMKEWEQRRAERDRERQARSAGQSQASAGGTNGAGGAAAQAGPAGTGGARGPDGGRGWGRGGGSTREQRKMRTESRDPDKTARRMAYFSAIHKRAEERGIQMPWGRDRGPR